MMPRLYPRKPDALRAQLTVALTEETLERLRRFAAVKGQSPTHAARDLIERGMAQPEQRR